MADTLLITGICGFAGNVIARELLERNPGLRIIGLDNFSRNGSFTNREPLRKLGITVIHGDVRNAGDLDAMPKIDWVIDAAANPSVLAGIDGQTSSRQIVENNLYSTVNLLELCRKHNAGFILLSTSRVYSAKVLAGLKMARKNSAYVLDETQPLPVGLSSRGVTEEFSTGAPLSIYGATKLSSEILALEYAEAFKIPVWLNRCGVLAGAGQFGKADQGIFSYWIHSYCRKRPLRYIGFDGQGFQVRDALHPRDLVPLLEEQMRRRMGEEKIFNAAGGIRNSASLADLTEWCGQRFGFKHEVKTEPIPRPYDVPWLILDSGKIKQQFGWEPKTALDRILEEIAEHAEKNPGWLDLSQ